jgi:hypothetical protein
MLVRIGRGVGCGVIALAGLTIMPTAGAASTTGDEFNAALVSAITASGVFAPGTTLTDDFTSMNEFGEPDRVNVSITNPDGTLVRREGYVGNVAETRCVRIDRCWQYHHDAFPSRRWRLLPSTEPAHYRQYAPEDFTAYVPDTPDGSTFSIEDVPAVGTVFTKSRDIAASGEGQGPGRTTETWIVSDGSLTETLSTLDQGVDTVLTRRTLTSSTAPISVVAPTRNALPEMQMAFVLVNINGCGGLPPSADCR